MLNCCTIFLRRNQKMIDNTNVFLEMVSKKIKEDKITTHVIRENGFTNSYFG
jgi:hypothetical protein